MLSSHEIEEQIEGYRLTFPKTKDRKVEWEMTFPMMVDTFNKMVNENHRIPSQDDFVNQYFEDNAEELAKIITEGRLKKGLEARLRRTYPSFVRDVHFGVLLRERDLDVKYDRDVDVCAGVDHIINYKGVTFYIHCYVGTKRGRLGRRLKDRRHSFRGVHLNVELDLDVSANKIGDFFLYGDKDGDFVIELMESELKHSL